MKFKKTIATIGTAVTLAMGSQIPISPKPLTLQEWQQMSALYNYEIGKNGGSISIQNWDGNFEQLNAVIRKRIPTESVINDGKKLSPQEYQVLREKILRKVETHKLIDVILNK